MAYRSAKFLARSGGAGRHDSFLARGRPTNPARGIRSRRLCAIGILLLAAAAQVPSAGAASITWAKKGEFETCLESSLDKWLAARAELEVNEHPTAAQLDDAAVATWTLETIAQCRARGSTAEAASEDRFAKHMAQWRQHIYDLAADIRKKGQSD